MKFLGLLVAVFSLAALGLGLKIHQTELDLMAGFGFVCAFATFRSHAISAYLKIFTAIFATEYMVFGAIAVAQLVGIGATLSDDLQMPMTVPMTVAMFATATYAVSHIGLVQRMMAIADRYFETRNRSSARIWPLPAYQANERTIAIAMVIFLVVVNQVQVLLSVRISFFGRDFINALNAKDAASFWRQLLVVLPILVFPYIASLVMEFIVQSTLIIRWRAWLTHYYSGRWLDRHAHYRMSVSGEIADNPDQRISRM